jgi:DNA-binding GntR family transcriptional regulator
MPAERPVGAATQVGLSPPTRSVLADDVYRILRKSLISGRIAPGARLNLDLLAREMHVSNTPVRQALALLESEGLVGREPFRGYSVSRLLDSRTIADLYDYRLLVEPPTAARAAQQPQHDGLSNLFELCDPHEIDALLASGAVSELGQRDIAFHVGIAQIAGNSVVVDNLAITLTKMLLYTVYDRHGAGELAWEEHRSIIDALATGDSRRAADAMRKHLASGFERMKAARQNTPRSSTESNA